MSASERLKPSPQKKLLALDGGGIRGMMSLEVLAEIERLLRDRVGRGKDFRLSDYFDYIAGTSTGAIIATCLSLGMSVDDVRTFYRENGKAMFATAGLWRRFRYKFDEKKLSAKLRDVFNTYRPSGEETADMTLGSSALKTLLLIILRNATTDSPWPLSNNPRAKYNRPERPDSNLQVPLWQVVRASTAAPTYFAPQEVAVGEKRFLFVDGGVTTYNNPAFLVFLMATAKPYHVEWPVGADRMLLVSVGTGTAARADGKLKASDMNLLYNATGIPAILMYAALNEQDLLCRAFGRCRSGDLYDREVGTLCGPDAEGGALPKLFTYMRYNADLSREGLDALGMRHIEPAQVQRLDSVDYMEQLAEVGRAIAKKVRPEHFDGFVSPTQSASEVDRSVAARSVDATVAPPP
jgi:hypothetical protein